MRNTLRTAIIACLLLLALSSQSMAGGLMLSPLRVDFTGKKRYATVTIMNEDKDNPVRYHIRMDPLRMTVDGKMIKARPADAREKLAMRLVRYSPSTAIIPAGGKQIVRLMLKKPANLPDGEYMTYFSVAPEPLKKTTTSTTQEKQGINLTMLVGIRIPLIIRHGEVSAIDEVESIKFFQNTNKEIFAQVLTSHKGNKSSIVGVRLEQILPSGEEIKLAESKRNVIYLPLTERKIRISIKDPTTLYKRGKVRVTLYDKENKGKVLSQKEFNI